MAPQHALHPLTLCRHIRALVFVFCPLHSVGISSPLIASSALPKLGESPWLCVFYILFGVLLFPDLSSEGTHVAWSIAGNGNLVDLLRIRIASGFSRRLDDNPKPDCFFGCRQQNFQDEA